MQNPGSSSLVLRAGELSLELCPAAGGTIVGMWHGTTPLMREPDRALLRAGNPRGAASWPLVPYSNRVRGARFAWKGREVTLERDALGGEHAIHGNGWRRPWEVRDESPSAAMLVHAHRPDGFWPFAYEARQGFALSPSGLVLWMAVTNTGDEDMPAGLGHHPYFRRTPGARLRVGLGEMWEGDDAKFPLRRVPVPARFDFSTGREVDPVDLDAVFVGWTQPARIEWPADGLALDISAAAIFGRLVVFVPPGQPFFAVEPVSHDTDAFNAPGARSGLRILAPGETLQGEMRFAVSRP